MRLVLFANGRGASLIFYNWWINIIIMTISSCNPRILVDLSFRETFQRYYDNESDVSIRWPETFSEFLASWIIQIMLTADVAAGCRSTNWLIIMTLKWWLAHWWRIVIPISLARHKKFSVIGPVWYLWLFSFNSQALVSAKWLVEVTTQMNIHLQEEWAPLLTNNHPYWWYFRTCS